ncbi:MAG: c-type cytochrome biogenesis protein CcmI [Geminicoccaceae bacterium]
MTSVALFLLMTAGAILLLALPFFRRQAAPDRRAFDLTVYQDQLEELERDLDRGIIDAEAARAAKLEIERRILAAAESEGASPRDHHQLSTGAMATAILVLIVPLASGLIYVKFGRPDMPDMPLASRAAPEQQLAGEDALLTNIEQLEKHLETTPDNGGVWMVLGRNRLRAGRYQAAVEAFEKGVEFSPEDPTAVAELAEAMVYQAGGQVTPSALERFKATLEQIPNEPRAGYYLGLALAQEGETDAAIDGWSQLLEISPSDAPWRAQIIDAVRTVLESEGRPTEAVIAGLPEGTAPGPEGAAASNAGAASTGVTSQQAIQALPPEEQNEQIRGMVEGLAARLEDEPDDVEGWLMLGRSRMVLDEPDAAKAAFERAVELDPERPDILLAYASSLLQPSEPPGGDPVVVTEAVGLYEKLLTLAPDDPEPRWLLGLAAAQTGNKEEAAGHWRELLSLIDEGSEDYGIVEARIAALEGDEPAADIVTNATPSLAPGTASTAEAEEAPSPADGTGPQPSAEDMAEMAALSSEERSDRIRSMVDSLAARLEDDSDDIEGWLRLGQSRNVLGEPEAAKEAYRRAMEVEPENPDVLRAYASSLLGDVHPETKVATVGEEAAGLYEKLIEIRPDDAEAHWYLGLAAVQDGTIDDAKVHWQRVLDVLGPDHPNYAAVQSSLEQVDTKTQ